MAATREAAQVHLTLISFSRPLVDSHALACSVHARWHATKSASAFTSSVSRAVSATRLVLTLEASMHVISRRLEPQAGTLGPWELARGSLHAAAAACLH